VRVPRLAPLERLERLRGALAVAREVDASVEQRGAAEWIETRLAEPAPGTATEPADEAADVRLMLAGEDRLIARAGYHGDFVEWNRGLTPPGLR
jgi:hypothetical protein